MAGFGHLSRWVNPSRWCAPPSSDDTGCQAVQQDISRDAPYWPGSEGRVLQQTPGIHEPLVSLGPGGREQCRHFVPVGLDTAPKLPARSFTVRMHFTELEDHERGYRVFDVSLQGKRVLENFDLAAEAGVRQALVRELRDIAASDRIVIEFVPTAETPTTYNAPLISALEVFEQGVEFGGER